MVEKIIQIRPTGFYTDNEKELYGVYLNNIFQENILTTPDKDKLLSIIKQYIIAKKPTGFLLTEDVVEIKQTFKHGGKKYYSALINNKITSHRIYPTPRLAMRYEILPLLNKENINDYVEKYQIGSLDYFYRRIDLKCYIYNDTLNKVVDIFDAWNQEDNIDRELLIINPNVIIEKPKDKDFIFQEYNFYNRFQQSYQTHYFINGIPSVLIKDAEEIFELNEVRSMINGIWNNYDEDDHRLLMLYRDLSKKKRGIFVSNIDNSYENKASIAHNIENQREVKYIFNKKVFIPFWNVVAVCLKKKGITNFNINELHQDFLALSKNNQYQDIFKVHQKLEILMFQQLLTTLIPKYYKIYETNPDIAVVNVTDKTCDNIIKYHEDSYYLIDQLVNDYLKDRQFEANCENNVHIYRLPDIFEDFKKYYTDYDHICFSDGNSPTFGYFSCCSSSDEYSLFMTSFNQFSKYHDLNICRIEGSCTDFPFIVLISMSENDYKMKIFTDEKDYRKIEAISNKIMLNINTIFSDQLVEKQNEEEVIFTLKLKKSE